MRKFYVLCFVFALSVFSGCGRCPEGTELKSDFRRFVAVQEGVYKTKDYIKRFVRTNIKMTQELPLDVERFLTWRKYQWWTLQDELAYLIHAEWPQISKLTADVGAYFHYEIVNFPKNKQSILNFFHNADAEWLNLVQDVAIFVEYNKKKFIPFKKQLKAFYSNRVDWEAAGLYLDVHSFLEWRNREYDKLIKSGKDILSQEFDLVKDFKMDVRRYGELAKTESKWIVADFKGFWDHSINIHVPRLVDGMYRYTFLQDVENLQRVQGYFKNGQEEAYRLMDAIKRLGRTPKAETKLAVASLNRFFKTYEREFGPLKADLKRFWRYNLSEGEVTLDYIKYYFVELTDEELFELKASVGRFWRYGGEEMKMFIAGLKRFLPCKNYRPAFGDDSLPSGGGFGGNRFDHDQILRTPLLNASQ